MIFFKDTVSSIKLWVSLPITLLNVQKNRKKTNYSSTHAVLVVDGFVDNETPKQEIKPSK